MAPPGKDAPVQQIERDELGPETEFCRKLYKDAAGNEIFVSLVLAGRDMNTSIHRPERCLPSQGWTVTSSRVAAVPLGDDRLLNVTRLHNVREIQTPGGRAFALHCLDYYWFVGCNETTPSHAVRMWIDMRDRLLKGYNQRWAYITVTAAITEGLQRGGLTEKQTDALIGAFIEQLAPKVQKPGLKLG